MVMGMSPGALCILSPISITGIYLTGVISAATGERGVFLAAIRYNFGVFKTRALTLLLAIGKLPLAGSLKKAHIRVKEGGNLWPPGTEITVTEDEHPYRGNLANLLLPVLVLIVSSIVAGTLEAKFLQARILQVGTFQTGTFQVNVLFGMIITLIFCFFLYCFQQYMTPEQFFRNVIFGFESMVAPIAIFLIGRCFANGMVYLGFSSWLDVLVHNLIRGQVWLMPPIIFCVCTFVGALFDNPWAMYAIGMPIAAGLAASVDGNTALYISAVCAAGLIGNEIAPGDIFFIGPMLGIDPMSYYRAKLPYVIVIALLTFCAYAAAGLYR
jgi:Na+/H+ antiporter NhaC